jgi:tRNA (guanosine-2'-O-)-methyltransferase
MSDSVNVSSFLSGLVTEKRLGRIEGVLAQRTRYITVALEDIYQSQNASAVLRTCECFGVQDVHIIENYNAFNINPMVLKGSDKWLNIHRYNRSDNNTDNAVHRLKSEGYRIVATSLHEDSVALNGFDIERGKFVIVFGNEHQGVSEDVMEQADEFLKIPMCGFTQSLNISVSAGIILSQLTEKIRKSNVDWQLTNPEKDILRAEWLQSSVKNPQMLINRLMEDDKIRNDT